MFSHLQPIDRVGPPTVNPSRPPSRDFNVTRVEGRPEIHPSIELLKIGRDRYGVNLSEEQRGILKAIRQPLDGSAPQSIAPAARDPHAAHEEVGYRHGQTYGNLKRNELWVPMDDKVEPQVKQEDPIADGQNAQELTLTGAIQAYEAGKAHRGDPAKIAALKQKDWHSSDQPRAVQTMKAFFHGAGIDTGELRITVTKELRERDAGVFAGWPRDKIRERWPEFDTVFSDPNVSYPEGECGQDTGRRAHEYLEAHRGNVGWFGHELTKKTRTGVALEGTVTPEAMQRPMPNAKGTRLVAEPGAPWALKENE